MNATSTAARKRWPNVSEPIFWQKGPSPAQIDLFQRTAKAPLIQGLHRKSFLRHSPARIIAILPGHPIGIRRLLSWRAGKSSRNRCTATIPAAFSLPVKSVPLCKRAIAREHLSRGISPKRDSAHKALPLQARIFS